MATSPSRRQTLVVLSAVGILISSTGCGTLGLMAQPTGGGGLVGFRPSPPLPLPADVLGSAGDSIFRVVGWGMAVVLGSLALAFVAKLLNGRPRNPRDLPAPWKRIPEAAATAQTTEV